jgi:hypothetical protein
VKSTGAFGFGQILPATGGSSGHSCFARSPLVTCCPRIFARLADQSDSLFAASPKREVQSCAALFRLPPIHSVRGLAHDEQHRPCALRAVGESPPPVISWPHRAQAVLFLPASVL